LKSALEINFPFEEIDPIAKRESYRKELYRPIYHTHKWWAQRLGSVFRALVIGATLDENQDIWDNFYQKQNYSGKIILDPFMGSGTTLGESIKSGCKAIGCDINPVSSFIVGQALRSIPKPKLIQTFNALETKVKARINRFYRKAHPVTGEECQVLYFFWVKVVTTPTGKQLPLFNNYVFSRNAYPSKKPNSQIICPFCYGINVARYDSIELQCYKCHNTFNPQEGPASGKMVRDTDTGKNYSIIELIAQTQEPPQHVMYAAMVQTAAGTREYLEITDADRELYATATIELEQLSTSYPEGIVEPGHNTIQALRYNYHHWRDFFNDRQRLCLTYLLEGILEIDDQIIKEAFIGLFSGTLEFNNMFCSFKGEGTGAVRHMFNNHVLRPEKTPLENSVWGSSRNSGSFLSLFMSRLLKAQEYRDAPFEIKATKSDKVFCSDPIRPKEAMTFDQLSALEEPAYLVLNGDSSKLPLPDKSVDAVITDPPYFDFVHYSELSDFFYAWLKPALEGTNKTFAQNNSRRTGEVQQKEPGAFAEALSSVFSECRRVMKDDAVLAFSFHHSRIEGWLAIYHAIEKAGLAIATVYPVTAEMSTASPKSAAKEPINLDAIFVCKKALTSSALLTDDVALWTNSQFEYRSLCKRLLAVGRELSEGDKRVIMVSSFLNQCSAARLSYSQVVERLHGKELKDLSEYLPEIQLEESEPTTDSLNKINFSNELQNQLDSDTIASHAFCLSA
jgi:putative DNA methylase